MTIQNMAIIIQGIILLISIGVVGVMIRQKLNEVTRYFIYASFLSVCENAGYLLELLSENAHELLFALRVEYLGASFISTFVFLFVATYCKFEVKKWFRVYLYVVNFLVLTGVWAKNYVHYFYKSVVYSTEGNVAHAVIRPGFFYYYFAIQNAVLFFLIFAIVILTIYKSKYVVARKNYIKVFLPISLPFLAYICYFLKIFGYIDPSPAGIALGCLLCSIIFVRDKTFTTFQMAHTAVYENMKQPVLIVDSNFVFLECNEEAKLELAEIDEYQMGEELPEEISNVVLDGKTEGELEYDGKIYSFAVSDIVEKETIFGHVISLTDVTEEVQQYVLMKELAEKAEAASHSKSAFLAQMSHEIRTPINSILGMNEMILRESKVKGIREYAMATKNSAQALLRIINDILDVSKIESGKMELVPVDYETASFVFDIVCMMKSRADEKGLAFVTDIDSMLPLKMHGDDIRIKQVIVNLLSNAIKYTEKGQVSLSIKCVFQQDDVILQVRVSDTGMGMKKEDIPKMLTAFQRVNQEQTRSIQGTGLGMHIVTTLLALMDSELMVDSEPGKGSTFSFNVRQHIVDVAPLGNFENHFGQLTAEDEYVTSFVAPDAKILVVDDNDMNRMVFSNLVKDTQVQVTEADSGYRCLELVAMEHFDLIFLDHMMPGMDGVETLKEMKKLDLNLSHDTPIVMLTANALSGAREEYMAMGFDDFLSKPIVPEKLEEMISKLLPKELIKVQQTSMKKLEEEEKGPELPDLLEFDFNYALELLKNKELLEKTLLDFYHSMDRVKEELNQLAAGIDDSKNLIQYRITVHALKSTAAMVGALLLSKFARLLEVAAIEEDVEKIKLLHPILMEEMDKHKERMSVFEPKVEKKELPPIEELAPMFAMLKNAIANDDYDTSDYLTEQVCGYEYPAEIQTLVDALKDQVLNLEEEEAIASCEEIGLALLRL